MIPIYKSTSNPLQEVCKIPGITFDDNQIPKNSLKKSLLEEQGFLCAYCMSRINESNMKVEHWQPQHPTPSNGKLSPQEVEENRKLSIDYKNMLAVCKGNEGSPYKLQHCDTHKGNKTLKYNPSDTSHHMKLQISYLISSGKIESADAEFCSQLGKDAGEEGVLNLNCERLMNNRLQVIKSINEVLSHLEGSASKAVLQKMLNDWSTRDSAGKFKPYAGVAQYFLEKRIRKLP